MIEPGTDRFWGVLLATTSVLGLIYCTAWILVTPFIEDEFDIEAFFPKRYYVVAIPAVLFMLFVTCITTFSGMVLLRARES